VFAIELNFSLASPDTPRELSISSIGSTWVKLKWSISMVYSVVAHYEISYTDHSGSGKTTNISNLAVNVTGLTPETMYEFVVVAVSSDGGVTGRSQPSNPVQCHTTILGKQY
jgi:chitodextrinase